MEALERLLESSSFSLGASGWQKLLFCEPNGIKKAATIGLFAKLGKVDLEL